MQERVVPRAINLSNHMYPGDPVEHENCAIGNPSSRIGIDDFIVCFAIGYFAHSLAERAWCVLLRFARDQLTSADASRCSAVYAATIGGHPASQADSGDLAGEEEDSHV
jgi:hypothetical protein